MATRREFDAAAYVKRVREKPCFVCTIVSGESDQELFYDDGDHIGFLSNFPSLLGYALVCPKRHVSDIVDELTTTEYLAMQAVVHRVARAVKSVVPTERMYVMSLGSMQGNSHVHWHIAPLPPGVPYERQQYHALMNETAGVLELSPAERSELTARLRTALAA